MKIFKYPFKIEDAPQVEIPCGHRILHVGLDPGGQPCIWALVTPEASKTKIQLRVVGTGHDEPEGKFLNTIVQGPFVWHIFLA